jgi:hypothetical protein
MQNIIRIALLAAALAAGVATEATALSFKNIGGKWCGLTTNYIFTQNSLTVTFHDGTPTRKFQVTGYEYLGDTVKMHWLSKGEKLYTDFSEFSADNRTMAQQKNEAGPRRPFRRCK